ncbi:RagB/SusD family nutrient uptake outer membrane protein [Alistipes sp.]|uniref:RagB/SusD family nutrient uptake outer membrane protein n=1 Tax=Alistipes sp. TaxID=1872444 RepID=UPI003AEFABC4
MKRIFLIPAAALALVSCKEYLDIQPYGQAIPKTADEFSSLLNSTLNKIDYGEEDIVGNVSSVMEYECFADNLEANLTSYPEGNKLLLYVGSNLSMQQQVYQSLYSTIRDCNITIGELKERDTRLGRDVLGTAYALRGVCYYELMRRFCPAYDPSAGEQLGLPLVTEFDMEAKPLRSTLAQTADRVIEDLKKAVEYDIQDEIYRFDNDVAKGYLARACFWTGRYAEAIPYAAEVLEKYPLLGGEAYRTMMESQIQKKGNTLFKAEILTSGDGSGLEGLKKYLRARPVSSRFLELFPEKSRDIRYQLSVGPERKNRKNIFASLRSAEMCLILAESYYHAGDEDRALEYLNLLRRHRIEGVADYTASTLPSVNPNERIKVDAAGNPLTPLLYAILSERRKEFYLENGDRWFELKRNGSPEFWVAQSGLKYTTEKFMYTFPIYIRDVLLVDGMIQNPGYENIE